MGDDSVGNKQVVGGLLCALVTLVIGTAAYAQGETYRGLPVVKVYVNGEPLQTDVPAVMLDGRTLVPLRAVSEAFGFQVLWNEAEMRVDVALAGSGEHGSLPTPVQPLPAPAWAQAYVIDPDQHPSISITWAIVEGACSYQIEQASGEPVESRAKPFIPLATLPATHVTEYTVHNPATGYWHKYRVRALACDGQPGAWSYTEEVKVQRATGVLLPAPAWITQAIPRAGTIIISWAAVPEANGYQIERNGQIIGWSDLTSYVDTAIAPNQSYRYRVRALGPNKFGEWSPYTEEIYTTGWSASSSLSESPPPAPRAGALKTKPLLRIVDLSWAAVPGASSYQIERNGSVIADVPSQVTTYSDHDVVPGQQYRYRVRALKGQYYGEWSGEAKVDTSEWPVYPASSSPPPVNFLRGEHLLTQQDREVVNRGYAWLAGLFKVRPKIEFNLYAPQEQFPPEQFLRLGVPPGARGFADGTSIHIAASSDNGPVLIHEMVHAFQLSVTDCDTLTDSFRRYIWGEGATSSFGSIPRWEVEGLAEYLETLAFRGSAISLGDPSVPETAFSGRNEDWFKVVKEDGSKAYVEAAARVRKKANEAGGLESYLQATYRLNGQIRCWRFD